MKQNIRNINYKKSKKARDVFLEERYGLENEIPTFLCNEVYKCNRCRYSRNMTLYLDSRERE